MPQGGFADRRLSNHRAPTDKSVGKRFPDSITKKAEQFLLCLFFMLPCLAAGLLFHRLWINILYSGKLEYDADDSRYGDEHDGV